MATSEVVHAHAAPQGFIRKYIFSLDHKIIGIQYFFLALTAVWVGMILSLFMRIHLIWPDVNLPLIGHIQPEAYLSLLTMHGTIMVFFVLTTAPQGGFGNYFLPIQIGAPDMAFPVLNMLSFWTTFVAFVIMLASFFVAGGAPLHGWTGYPPLSAVQSTGPGEGLGADLWITSIAIFCAASLMGALNFITTTLDLRAKGMTLMRMPLTVWSWFITAILGLLAFGVLLSAGILLLMDRNLGTSFFLPVIVVNGQLSGSSRGLPAPVAALVLVLWASRGVHRDSAGHGRGLAGSFHFLAQADLRLSRHGVRNAGDRIPGLHGLGPSHVHERDEPVFGIRLLAADHGDRRAVGHQDVQLAGDDLQESRPLLYADVVRHRLRIALRLRRTERTVPGSADPRHSAARHVLRGRATST